MPATSTAKPRMEDISNDSGSVSGLRQRSTKVVTTASVTTQAGETEVTTTTTTTTRLLLWDDLPSWRRDNAFILSGYRHSHPSYIHTLLSLTHLHNESVNIWSHLIGVTTAVVTSLYLYFLVQPRYQSASQADVIVFACFFGGAILCLGMSATFHALLSHSERVASWGNKLDYSGIVALIVGSYMPALYYGFFCRPSLMSFYMGLICVLGAGCGIVSWVDKFRTPSWRPYRAGMFIGLGLSGVFPIVHGIAMDGYDSLDTRMSVSLIILHGAMYVVGAVLYAVRWPERTWPGSFDLWGSSHQIFHIFVLIAAGTHFYAMSKAFDYHHTVMGSQCATN